MKHFTQSWEPTKFTVFNSNEEPFEITVSGRLLWALIQLETAGATGCTQREHPGTRLSAYVHKLRRKGVGIETEHAPNHGEFPGHHGVYRLTSRIVPCMEKEVAQ